MQPYEEYADRIVEEIRRLEEHGSMSTRELKQFIMDAWIAGISYILKLIEEAEKSPLRVRLRDEPKKFEGGVTIEPFIYCQEDK